MYRRIKLDAIEKGIVVDTINGVEDHVHCLIRMRPAQTLSSIVKQIKGSSSRWVNKNGLLNVPFKWQTGYGAFSVSPADLDKVRKYICNQEQHHKTWELDRELSQLNLYYRQN